MAISWGAYANGRQRVGIECWTDGYNTNTPSINVYVAVYVSTASFSYSDNQHISLTGNVGAEWDFFNGLGSNSQTHIGTATLGGQGQSYGGGPTYYFHAQLSGAFDGSNPAHAVNFTLPARPPNVPTNPPVSVDSITATSARVVVSAANGRGAAVDAYEVAISAPGGSFATWSQSWSGGTGTATNLQPVTVYKAAARAHNAVGWSSWTESAPFTSGGTAPATPVAPTISSITTSGGRVNYTAPNNGGAAITGYDVQIATNSGFTTGVQTIADTASPYDFTGLVNHQDYWVRVRAKNSIGTSAYSPAAQFTTLMTVTATTAGGSKTPFSVVSLTGADVNDATVSKRQWTQKSGSPTVTLTGATGKTPTFYAPGTLAGTTLVFTYTVTDTANRTYSIDVPVIVAKARHKAVIGGVESPMEFRES